MSRTDKTDPFWVQSQRDPRAVAWHAYSCEHSITPGRSPITQPCDLPPAGEVTTRDTACRRWSSYAWHRIYKQSGAWDITGYYYRPERARTRRALVEARRDFNTYGDTDVDVLTDQHRHAPWGGGWWD